jgi:hypothetical protein
MQICPIFSLGQVLLLVCVVFAAARVDADTTYPYKGPTCDKSLSSPIKSEPTG